MKDVLQFLRELEVNNNRAWFEENKKRYLAVKALHEAFVAEIIRGIGLFDPEVAGLEVKDTVFRIYRDVRFSPDKSPYKTHIGTYLAKGGRKSPRGGYYVHLEPGRSFFSGGIWCPEAPVLKALREDVFNSVDEFKAIINEPEFARYYSLEADKLKKVPVPYPKDSPGSEWVKYKSYTASSMEPDSFFEGKDLVERCVGRLQLLVPLNRFLNYTVDEFLK